MARNAARRFTTRSSNSSRTGWPAERYIRVHDPQIVADIIVGALSGALANWRVDTTYSLPTNLHNLGVALADLLLAD